MKTVAIAAFATEGPYEAELKGLAQSIGPALINHLPPPEIVLRLGVISGIHHPTNAWQARVSYKITYLLDILTNTPADWILFVDADARFVRLPPLLQQIVEMDAARQSIAVHYLDNPGFKPDGELLAGTILLSNCPENRELLRLWDHHCRLADYAVWDQKILQDLLKGHRVNRLAPEWCWIDGGHRPMDISESIYGARSPYILQTQASRRLRAISDTAVDVAAAVGMEETT